MALFRIAIASVWLGDLAIRATDLRMFYSDSGVYPRSLLLQHPYSAFPSVYLLSGSTVFQATLFLITALVALGLLVGYKTRWMTCLSWYLAASLQARNFLINQGGDDYLKMVLFWGMFLPLGERFSIDASIQKCRTALTTRHFNMGTLGMIGQTLLIYITSAIYKSQGHQWWDGSALSYVFNLDVFAKRPGIFLLQYPVLLRGLTRATVIFEFLCPFLLISPITTDFLKTAAVGLFIGFQLVLFFTLALGPFPWVCIAAALIFLPSGFWDVLLKTSTPETRCDKPPFRASGGIALMSMVAILYWTAGLLWPSIVRVPPWFERFCYTLQIKQKWGMFSPDVSNISGWVVIPGTLRNGELVNLHQNGVPLNWTPPKSIPSSFKNERQRKYFMNMRYPAMEKYRSPFSHFICEDWNNRHSEEKKVIRFEVFYLEREYNPSYPEKIYQKNLVWNASCLP